MLRLEVGHLPDAGRCLELLRDGHAHVVEGIERKNTSRNGASFDRLTLPADAIWTALDHVGGERKRVVEAATARDPSYREPAALFLSSTTGGPLRADSVTHLVGDLLRAAGVRNAGIHRLRACYIVAVVEALISELEGAEVIPGLASGFRETILVKAANPAGNS